MLVPPKDLRLRDVVELSTLPDSAFMTATVFNIKDGVVYLLRPYIHTSDVETSGGVTPYIGFETVSIMQSDPRGVNLLRSEPVR